MSTALQRNFAGRTFTSAQFGSAPNAMLRPAPARRDGVVRLLMQALRIRLAKMLRNKKCPEINRGAQNGSRTPLKMFSLLQMRSALPCGNAVGFPVPGLHG